LTAIKTQARIVYYSGALRELKTSQQKALQLNQRFFSITFTNQEIIMNELISVPASVFIGLTGLTFVFSIWSFYLFYKWSQAIKELEEVEDFMKGLP